MRNVLCPSGLVGNFFGRVLAGYAWNIVNFCCVSVPSLAAPVNVYRLRNDYALYEVRSDGVDTVGVWGSNPHAPTIIINSLQREAVTEGRFCVVDCAITL